MLAPASDSIKSHIQRQTKMLEYYVYFEDRKFGVLFLLEDVSQIHYKDQNCKVGDYLSFQGIEVWINKPYKLIYICLRAKYEDFYLC
jgi:hypothetical protein